MGLLTWTEHVEEKLEGFCLLWYYYWQLILICRNLSCFCRRLAPWGFRIKEVVYFLTFMELPSLNKGEMHQLSQSSVFHTRAVDAQVLFQSIHFWLVSKFSVVKRERFGENGPFCLVCLSKQWSAAGGRSCICVTPVSLLDQKKEKWGTKTMKTKGKRFGFFLFLHCVLYYVLLTRCKICSLVFCVKPTEPRRRIVKVSQFNSSNE